MLAPRRRRAKFPLPRARPALKSDKPLKSAAHSAPRKGAAEPMLRAVPSRPLAAHASIPSAGVRGYEAPEGARRSAALEASRPTPLHALSVAPRAARPDAPLAMAATANTSPLDLAAVKQVIDLAHKGRPDEATDIAGTISDPLARKLAEWVILRSDDADLDFPRYAAFIAANPSWPSIIDLAAARRGGACGSAKSTRRRSSPSSTAIPPRTAKGRFALARALLAKGDRAGAQAAVREAWRKDGFSAELEAQARETFAGLITRGRRQGAHGRALLCRGRRCRLARRAPARSGASSPSPRRAPPSSTNPPRPRRCSMRCRLRPGTIPAICSAASNGCAAPTRSPRPRSGCSRRRTRRTGSAMSINGGSSGGSSRANCSTSAIPSRPTRSPAAAPHRPTKTIAPSSNSPPAGSRCASCASRRRRSPIFPASPTASPIRSRWRAPYYWQGRAAEALGRGSGCARLLRGGRALSHRLLRPAVPRAAWARRRHVAQSAGAARRAAPARSRARLRDPLRARRARSRRRHGCRPRRQDDRRRRAGDARRDRHAAQRRARDALDRQDRCGPRLTASSITPFRTSACRATSRSGPRSSAASSIRSCARKAPSTRGSSPAPTPSA